jgi:hypothetical protein
MDVDDVLRVDALENLELGSVNGETRGEKFGEGERLSFDSETVKKELEGLEGGIRATSVSDRAGTRYTEE